MLDEGFPSLQKMEIIDLVADLTSSIHHLQENLFYSEISFIRGKTNECPDVGGNK